MKRISLTAVSMLLMLLTTKAATSNYSVRKKADRPAKHYVIKKARPLTKAYLAELTKNIEYDFAKISIKDIYDSKLDQLAQAAIDNKYAIALRGYADSIGTYKGNWVLSDKRANAVKDYLVKKGVDADKIVATPFGSTLPIASNKTKAGRQKNRRVEIKINEVSKN